MFFRHSRNVAAIKKEKKAEKIYGTREKLRAYARARHELVELLIGWSQMPHLRQMFLVAFLSFQTAYYLVI